ncbi:MAG: thioredoxin-disulfide reductase [Eubacterium sp.]|nr:thioredoxin-disulfide reductase [Eubacterium sp.]
MTDVIIIGAGPAGLAASIYVQRSGKQALLLEAGAFGGQIINTAEIENYPGIKKISGFDFAMSLYEQATGLGAKIIYEKADKIEDKGEYKTVYTASGKTYDAKTVIIATGAKNRHLMLDKEEAFTGKGISYCATCDGAFYKGKEVAVNGGGNTAIEDALFLSNYCSKVYIIHRREEFRGDESSLELLKNKENVSFILNSNIIKILGEERLSGIRVKNNKTEEERDIDISGLFIAIGQEPDNKGFINVVDVNEAGYVEATEELVTKTPGIFTAGDCRIKEVRQLATAVSDGAVAGLKACQYIK